MPRKPNYKFERMERQKAKAAKKAARQEAKMEKAEKRKAEEAGIVPEDETAAESTKQENDMARLNQLLGREE